MDKSTTQKTYTEKDFITEYEQLCERMGYRMNISPIWILRDDGTWSTKLNIYTEKLPQKIDK